MKYHQITPIRIVSGVALFLLALSWTGCTKNFEKRNTKPDGIEILTPPEVKALFPTAVYNGWNIAYQTGQNQTAGMYCQYFYNAQTAFATHRYVMNQQWMTSWWRGIYVSTIPAILTIIRESDKNELPAMSATARIWKVYILNRYTDYFGPIPYSQIGNYVQGEGVAYDAQKDIYYDFFKELDEAVAILKDNLGAPSFGEQDVIYEGNNAQWIKFANTLRLRLALRISFVEPEKARTEAEAAFAGGILEDNADNAFISPAVSRRNYLNYISAWNEFRMSANFESLFKGYNDPRMPIYFSPAVSDGAFRGGRSGMVPGEQTQGYNTYSNNSDLGPMFSPDNMNNNPLVVMYAAEAYFLRAEGVMNGWNVGGGMTAEELYNKGIETSLRQWGIEDQSVIDTYINGTSLPIAPAPENGWNTPPLTDVPVKFSSDPEEQREQIGTQKWIAIYPSDMEAWAEMRRTGYPKMYPLIHSGNPDMPADQMIRRIVFVDIERQANGPAVEAATELLGPGGDKVSTRLWWDVKP